MSKITEHINEEQANWQQTQEQEREKTKASQRHLIYNVLAYLAISIIEYWLAMVGKSQTLRADAFNNLSGIISTALLMMGLHISQYVDKSNDIAGKKFSDEDQTSGKRQQMVRWRYETVFSLITSVIMIAIAINVIFDGIKSLTKSGAATIPQPVAIIGAAIASVIMLCVWYLNRRAGKKLQNAALTASAQDSLSDAFTSLGTMIAIAGALFFKIDWLDGAASIVVGFFILYSGIQIFSETSLNLTGYFDPQAEHEYREVIKSFAPVNDVVELTAHYNGNVVSVDTTVEVDAKMTALEIFQLSEQIESRLRNQFGIIDTDVSVVPDPKTFTDDDIKGTF